MRVRRIVVAAALVLAPLGSVVPASHAAVPQCEGVDATIVGSDASEKLFGTEGPDVVVLGAGDDIFAGKGGDDLVCAGTGGDVIYPGAGNDTVFGEDGDDRVYEGTGDDDLDGGAGKDTLTYSQFGGIDLRLDARIGNATSSNGTDTFNHFYAYQGSPGSDTLIGSIRDERIWGNGGAKDAIYGFGGNDLLVSESTDSFIDGGDGNDRVGFRSATWRILLGAGNDKLFFTRTGSATGSIAGGTGVDAIALGSSKAGYTVSLNQEFVSHNSTPDHRLPLLGFENVDGSDGPDWITGNSLPNSLYGRGGDDVIYGLGGADRLNGGYNFDFAYGGAGEDACFEVEVRESC